jgi:hypothetical protein
MKKKISKKKPKKIKRIEDSDPVELNPPAEEQKNIVQTEIVIESGIVVIKPIYNPFDEIK